MGGPSPSIREMAMPYALSVLVSTLSLALGHAPPLQSRPTDWPTAEDQSRRGSGVIEGAVVALLRHSMGRCSGQEKVKRRKPSSSVKRQWAKRNPRRTFRTASGRCCSRRRLVRLHVGPQNGVDAGLVAWPLRLEPL